ncbi:polysaccharide biosynthesis/export family protein [Rhodoligotrophos defluvii]|uniref:polysaccharide biosynthesis/export family protein n=1 Tax=Rhodoligotrophos defluvii TaxID=2561934 RepID=UPI00195FBC1C|nr:polysaccharide biosynthesis/export family protein [Rhodoligotrophos defluvii]
MSGIHQVSAAILLSAGLVACTTTGNSPVAYQPATTATPASVSPGEANVPSYRLGSGDKLRVIVFGENDLSGEFELDASGSFSLPLVGQINANGLTAREVEERIAAKLRDGYLRNPSVSVEVLNYRPFYIHGEVKSAGEYPYTNGLTLQAAVAKAGGYTYRANTTVAYIRRANATTEQSYNLDRPIEILPGDTIRIAERFF